MESAIIAGKITVSRKRGDFLDTLKKHVRNNKILAILAAALRTASLLCVTGPLMQTFLTMVGFSAQQAYVHSTAVQAANVLTILLFSRFGDRGNILRRTALVQIPNGILFLAYLPLCFMRNGSTMAFILLLAVSVLQSVSTALHTVCEYKLPYFIYHAHEYGTVTAICGILGSGISFGMSAIITTLDFYFDYVDMMLICFIISALFLFLSFLCQWFLRSLIDMDAVQEKKGDKSTHVPLSRVFRHPAFYLLAAPNLLRGVAYGMTTVLAVIALNDLGYESWVGATMASVHSIVTLGACLLFGVVSRFISPRYSVFVGSLTFIAMPLLLIPESPWLFLVLSSVLMFGRTLVDYGVPSVLLYAVPVEIAGPYNAFRMILHNGGTMLATLLAAFLPSSVLLPVATVFQLASGIFYLALPLLRRASPAIVRKQGRVVHAESEL